MAFLRSRKASARVKYTTQVTGSTALANGMWPTTPAPANAYSAQVNRTPAIASVKSVDRIFLASTASAIFAPAPMKRYAVGPRIMRGCAEFAVNGKNVFADQFLGIAGHQYLAKQGFYLIAQTGHKLGNACETWPNSQTNPDKPTTHDGDRGPANEYPIRLTRLPADRQNPKHCAQQSPSALMPRHHSPAHPPTAHLVGFALFSRTGLGF